jgi:hypothetical protein
MDGFLPPSSRERWARRSPARLAMPRPTSVEPVKEILSTPGWSTRALPADLRHQEDGQRRVLGGLEDDGVPRGQGGRDLEAGDHQRRVPREDRADDPERLLPGVLQLRSPGRQCRALHLPRYPAEVAEQVDQ